MRSGGFSAATEPALPVTGGAQVHFRYEGLQRREHFAVVDSGTWASSTGTDDLPRGRIKIQNASEKPICAPTTAWRGVGGHSDDGERVQHLLQLLGSSGAPGPPGHHEEWAGSMKGLTVRPRGAHVPAERRVGRKDLRGAGGPEWQGRRGTRQTARAFALLRLPAARMASPRRGAPTARSRERWPAAARRWRWSGAGHDRALGRGATTRRAGELLARHRRLHAGRAPAASACALGAREVQRGVCGRALRSRKGGAAGNSASAVSGSLRVREQGLPVDLAITMMLSSRESSGRPCAPAWRWTSSSSTPPAGSPPFRAGCFSTARRGRHLTAALRDRRRITFAQIFCCWI